MRWTEEQDAALIRMHGRYTYREIGLAVGRSHKGVEARIGALGLVRIQQTRSAPDFDWQGVTVAFNSWRAPAPAQLSWRV